MSTRFFTNAAILLIAGAMVVLSVGLSSTTAVAWTAFGVGIAVIAIAVFAQLDTRRSATQRMLDAAILGTAGTLTGVSIAYGGNVVKWLDFALAIGLAGLALIGLAVHEVEDWRSNRQLRELHWMAPESVVPRQRAGVAEPAARREEVQHIS